MQTIVKYKYLINIDYFQYILCVYEAKALHTSIKSHIVLIYGNLCKIVGNNGKCLKAFIILIWTQKVD